MAVSDLNTRITHYLFAPSQWANAKKLVATMQQKPEQITQVNDAFLDLVGKSLKPELTPPFFETFANRLVLLTIEEWQKLAICVALLPYSGKIARSMDGYFRRAVRDLADPEMVSQVDSLTLESKPVFVGNWADVSTLTHGVINAVMDACNWPEPVKEYTLLRFEDSLPAANIEQLTISQIEVACKISLPNLSWL